MSDRLKRTTSIASSDASTTPVDLTRRAALRRLARIAGGAVLVAGAGPGLAQMQHVRLLTPLDPELAAGIVSFDVQGMSAQAVVDRLAEHNIVASVTPYDVPYARLSPGLLNSTAEIDETLAVIRDMA